MCVGGGGEPQEFYCTLKLVLAIIFWSDSERKAALIFSRPFSGYLCCRTRGLKFSFHATMLHHDINALNKSHKDSQVLVYVTLFPGQGKWAPQICSPILSMTVSSAYQHLSPMSYFTMCQESYGQWKSTKKMFRCIMLYG